MKTPPKHKFDLEERTLLFARRTRQFLSEIRDSNVSVEDKKQLTRSSGSVGANYIEANESLSQRDFLMRIKICRKEAKESLFWLSLIDVSSHEDSEKKKGELMRESVELGKIFGAIIKACEGKYLGEIDNGND